MERQYKDSGLRWIGKIPETWKVDRFKNRFKTGKGLNITKGDLVSEGIPVVSYGQVHSKKNTGTRLNDFLIRYIPSILAEGGVTSKVSIGDFIFADTSEDIDGCGNAVYVDKEIGLYAGYHSVIAFAKHPEESKYYAYLFLTECWRSQIRMRVTGIKVFSISQAILNETTIILPPLAEQQHIADFLDKKCGEIDGLIALQEQMIAQLTDYKLALITETVTKGLNSDALLVPSGIDWIGDVPEGWNRCAPLKWFTEIILGKMLQSNANLPTDTLEKYICAKDVHFDGIDYSDLKSMYYSPSEKVTYKVQKGDMLVVEGGAGAAGAAIVDKEIENTYIQNSIMIVRPKRNIDIRYARYVLFSIVSRGYVDYICNKATIPHFTKDKLSGTLIPRPSIVEQCDIADHLDTKCGEIDKLIETKRQKIETLKEYKKSVIYEAVTGKTDLRDS